MADETRKGPEKYQSSRKTVQYLLPEGPDHLEAQGCRMTLQSLPPEAQQAQPPQTSQPQNGQAPPQPSQPVQEK